MIWLNSIQFFIPEDEAAPYSMLHGDVYNDTYDIVETFKGYNIFQMENTSVTQNMNQLEFVDQLFQWVHAKLTYTHSKKHQFCNNLFDISIFITVLIQTFSGISLL